MVQAPSALLWPRSKKPAGNGHDTCDNGESDGTRSRSRLAGSLTSNAVEDALMNVMSMSGSAPSSSSSDAMHKGESVGCVINHACMAFLALSDQDCRKTY